MQTKYEVSISSKVIAKVKADNRQTDRQDKNKMPPIIRKMDNTDNSAREPKMLKLDIVIKK